ncbi:MAG: VWA domain-containing protein [Pseudomonadales bacterium]|nr:VWA domain-containing protein [Pseudomonadales bacterium]MCP5183804.1 VWA domain-containing protein [Pseudomonadales bacterium]
MMEFVWPWMFVLLPLPILVILWRRRDEDRQPALTVPDLTAFRFEEKGLDSRRPQARFPFALLLLGIAWCALVTAAARPQWSGEPEALPVTGRDLMLAVDISGSMGTEDMALGGHYVDRLSVVKDVISAFLERRKGDRVGLILFGTNAYLQAPLTFDLATVGSLLQEAPIGIAGGKTAVGDAIGLGVKRLRSRPSGDRVLILLTDGASNAGEMAPIKAAELAAAVDVRIYTIGVGASEMRLPGLLGRLGSRVVNPSADLDEETLTKVADATGGRYFRAENPRELAEIYALIDGLEPVEQEAETFRPIRALFIWPMSVALVAMLLLLGGVARRRNIND